MIQVDRKRSYGKAKWCINPVHIVGFGPNDVETVEVVTVATQGGLSDGKLLVYSNYVAFLDAYQRAIAGEDVTLIAG